MDDDNHLERSIDFGGFRRRTSDLRRPSSQGNVGLRTASDNAAAASSSSSSSSSTRGRWAHHSVRNSRSRLHQHRLRRRNEDDAMGTVQEAVDRLNEANSDLSSILDEPLPQILSSDDFFGIVPEAEVLERRHKRRKLDGDVLDTEIPPKYGYYGQVIPGRLRMSILGCDGGYLSERDENCLRRYYSPENVLRNDKSVYCTEKNQCNIILKHWKETPFSVTKIVIKTPDNGFPAPVQEGLIFVSMTADHLISHTAQYQISQTTEPYADQGPDLQEHNYGHRNDRDSGSRDTQSRPIIHFGQANDLRSGRYQSTDPATVVRTASMLDSIASHRSWTTEDHDSDQAQPHESIPMISTTPQSQVSRLNTLEFNVTSTCDDPTDDEEDSTSPAILLDRQRRRHLGLEWPSSDEESENSATRGRRARSRPREIKSIPTPNDEARAAGDPILPHARFFIEQRRNVVSVKFHPAVSGKYILVKMWSPEYSDNLDIQAISVYGFAGTRFIPSIEPRNPTFLYA